MTYKLEFHSHAIQRMLERGASKDEVMATVETGERISAKNGRLGFRRNFEYNATWCGKHYAMKQLEVFAAEDGEKLVIVTVIAKYF